MGIVKISVENFGPIARGTVVFKPLTVMIGRNNSGKSYLTALYYALHEALSSSSAVWDALNKLIRGMLESILDVINKYARELPRKITFESIRDLASKVADILISCIQRISQTSLKLTENIDVLLKALSNAVSASIQRIFQVSLDKLIQINYKETHIFVEVSSGVKYFINMSKDDKISVQVKINVDYLEEKNTRNIT